MADSKKTIEAREERKKNILKKREESGYLSEEQFVQLLKSKGIVLEKDTKNLPRFARNNKIAIQRFGRIGKKGSDPAFYKKPDQNKIEKILYNLKYKVNNSYAGRKEVEEKKKKVISILKNTKEKEKRDDEDKVYRYAIAEDMAEEGVPTNRQFVAKVIRENFTKTEMTEKLNRPVIKQQPKK